MPQVNEFSWSFFLLMLMLNFFLFMTFLQFLQLLAFSKKSNVMNLFSFNFVLF